MTDDSACAVARGSVSQGQVDRELVAVFDSPVARFLLRYAQDAGFGTALLEPDTKRAEAAGELGCRLLTEAGGRHSAADVVVTDHHRAELGPVLREVLAQRVRWVGVMGNPRHPAPHVPALRELDVAEADINRVHRPIGLNIGSRAPAEIAIATIAGLIADRNGRDGGFHF